MSLGFRTRYVGQNKTSVVCTRHCCCCTYQVYGKRLSGVLAGGVPTTTRITQLDTTTTSHCEQQASGAPVARLVAVVPVVFVVVVVEVAGTTAVMFPSYMVLVSGASFLWCSFSGESAR